MCLALIIRAEVFKFCRRGMHFLPLCHFGKKKRYRDGRNCVCINCCRASAKKYRERRKLPSIPYSLITMSVNLLNRRPLDKYCPRCEKFLGKESFHKDQATEDGKTFYCKGCRQKLRSFVCLKGKQTKEPIFICDSTALIKREDIFKPCSKCHRILLLKEFPFACNCNHRRRPECRNCSNSYHKKWISDKKEEKKPNIRISLLVDLGGKFCRRCWEFLSLEDFPLCKKGKLRRSCWCKECKKNADRIYYGNNTGECITRSTAYGIKRYHTNIQAKMRAILRSRLHGVLKGGICCC